MTRPDPLRKFRFRLAINSIQQAGFSEVTIGDLSTDPIEYREGDEVPTVRKLNGLTKYGNITLKWGMTDSTELSEWHQRVAQGGLPLESQRKNVVIHVIDEAGQDKAHFEIIRAWPCKYDPTDLNGTGNEVAIDTLELCNEGIRRLK
jgi:phage tail-like protein